VKLILICSGEVGSYKLGTTTPDMVQQERKLQLLHGRNNVTDISSHIRKIWPYFSLFRCDCKIAKSNY